VGNRVETREKGLILAVRFSMELKSVAEAVYAPKLVDGELWSIEGFNQVVIGVHPGSH
jgi:hypothetical protein